MTRLEARLQEPGLRVLSLDVFDTVLLRSSAPELVRLGAIAQAQARALGRPDLVQALYRARLRGQKALYDQVRGDGVGEVRHQAIIAAMVSACGLDDAAGMVLAAAEIAWERQALRPNHALLDVIARFIEDGVAVVLVSDMYLPQADVAGLVAHHAPLLAGCPLYVSAEWAASKRRGDLYACVAAQLAVDPVSILHVGDNPHADGRMAEAAGWRSVVLPRPWWWRWLNRRRDRWVRARLARLGWLVASFTSK